jgi:hypothetical protein
MPIDGDGQCIPFTAGEITDMEITTPGVRDGSHPTETREAGTNTTKRTFFCKWEERYNFVELVIGNVSLWDDAGTIRLSRLLPDDTYGRHPEHTQIVATKIESITGFKYTGALDGLGMPLYEKAKVDVFFEHVPYDLLADAEVVSDEWERYTVIPGLQEEQSEADYITMPGGGLNYIREADSGTSPGTIPHLYPIPFNVGFVTPTQTRTFRWVRLPDEAWGNPASPLYQRVFVGDGDERPFLGTVSKEEFFGYPMGTLMFDHVKERRYRSPLGSGYWWDLDIVFRYKPQGWNWFRYFDPARNADGTPLNPTANGIYFVAKGRVHYYSDTLPDNTALYDARDPNLLWDVT